MKKIFGVIIIVLLFITVFTGCNESKKDKNQIISANQIFSIPSEDGNTIVNVETTLDYNDEKSIENISVAQNGVVINTIDNTGGYYDSL